MAHRAPPLSHPGAPTAAPGVSGRRSVLIHAAFGALLGPLMAWLVIGDLADFGSHGPLVQQMLALGADAGSDNSLQAVAAGSGTQLLRFSGLLLATGSALALLYGAASGFIGAGRAPNAPRAIRIGLWLALAISLLSLLPLQGVPFSLGLTRVPAPMPAMGWDAALFGLAAASAGALVVSGVLLRRTAEPGPARG